MLPVDVQDIVTTVVYKDNSTCYWNVQTDTKKWLFNTSNFLCLCRLKIDGVDVKSKRVIEEHRELRV